MLDPIVDDLIARAKPAGHLLDSQLLRPLELGRWNPIAAPLRANIAETLLVSLITEQGGKEIQHEEHEDILSGPVRRAQ